MKLKYKMVIQLCPNTEESGQSQDTHFILNAEQSVSEEAGQSSAHSLRMKGLPFSNTSVHSE